MQILAINCLTKVSSTPRSGIFALAQTHRDMTHGHCTLENELGQRAGSVEIVKKQ